MTTLVDAGGAAEVLARHREVTVLCHVRPDADALGSSAGLARALRAVGVVVHLKDQTTGDSLKYQLVGSAEANASEKKLSIESPVGNALLRHKRGEVVSVQVPRGPKRRLKITKIEAA